MTGVQTCALPICARGEDADAVVLDLEQPRRVRRRLVDERGEHHEIAARRDLAARRLVLGEATAQGLDPARAAAVVLELASMDNPPLRILLGSDAFEAAEKNDLAKIELGRRWKELSQSTDFPKPRDT